jgi:15-cis-phytoene synthase
MFDLFDKTSAQCSQVITQAYSTSFSLGIRTLHQRYREPIYAIYGMVRYADEIVDTFHDFDKKHLLDRFKQDTFDAISSEISLNPILFSFQKAVVKYDIPLHLIASFFQSMETDLDRKEHDVSGYQEYIYGSAEVVGLMCMRVFAEGNEELYTALTPAARALGSAFQKVNFLRDVKSDHTELGRVYFPGVDFEHFAESAKVKIEQDIAADFAVAYQGILLLPAGARDGVMLAYKYYTTLFERIKKVPVCQIKEARIRVPDLQKLSLLAAALVQQHLRGRAA